MSIDIKPRRSTQEDVRLAVLVRAGDELGFGLLGPFAHVVIVVEK